MLLERIIGVFARVKAAPCLAALGMFGIASAASGQTVTFDFGDTPSSATIVPECVGEIEPVCFNHYYDPVFAQDLFTVAHDSGGGYQGVAEWLNVGHIVLSDDNQGGDSPYQTTINFSEPVSSFSIQVSLDDDGADASIQVFIPDSDPPPNTEVSYTGGDFVLYEFSDGPYEGLRLFSESAGSLEWDNLEVTIGVAYSPDSTGARDVPVETGEDQTVIELDAFLMVAGNVLAPIGGGDPTIDFDFCVARDLREAHAPNGPSVYTRRALLVSEVAGTGSCTGDLPGGETTLPNSAGTVTTWEQLLPKIDLVIPPWNRTFRGDFEGVDGFWFVVASIRTNVEFDGPILVKEIPEIFPGLVYDDLVADTEDDGNDFDELACNATLAMRPSGLAGLVTAFGEWPNVELNLMIKSTFRCNRPETMTRRTHHVYPVRHDGVFVDQKAGLILQLAGIGATIQEAMSCAAAGPSGVGSLNSMRVDLLAATVAALLHQWNKALMRLESIATKANMTAFSTSDGCVQRNYKGNLVARGLTGAFTVWDSFLHPTVAGWEKYDPPSGLVPPDPTLP